MRSIEDHIRLIIADINKLKTVYEEMSVGGSPYDPPELQQVLYHGKWLYKIELKSAIEAHEARLETLRKIKHAEAIDESEHQKLMEMDVFQEDVDIKNYLLIVSNNS